MSNARQTLRATVRRASHLLRPKASKLKLDNIEIETHAQTVELAAGRYASAAPFPHVAMTTYGLLA